MKFVYNLKFGHLIVALFLILVTVSSVFAVDVPFDVYYDFEDLFSLQTVVNFRQHLVEPDFSSGSGSCWSLYGVPETIPVSFRLSSPPKYSLKSIEFSVADNSLTPPQSCFASFYLDSEDNPTRTVYSPEDIHTCAGLIPNPYGKGMILNPDCPINFFPSDDFIEVSGFGSVVFDDDLNEYVCRFTEFPKAYRCYSDVCGGRDLVIKDVVVCAGDSPIDAYDSFIGGVSSDVESVGLSGSPFESSNTNASFINKFINIIIDWFNSLFIK